LSRRHTRQPDADERLILPSPSIASIRAAHTPLRRFITSRLQPPAILHVIFFAPWLIRFHEDASLLRCCDCLPRAAGCFHAIDKDCFSSIAAAATTFSQSLAAFSPPPAAIADVISRRLRRRRRCHQSHFHLTAATSIRPRFLAAAIECFIITPPSFHAITVSST